MKAFIITFCFYVLSLPALLTAQEDYYLAPSGQTELNITEPAFVQPPFSGNKLSTSLNMGSSFSSFYGNSLFTNYIAPEVAYTFNPEFRLVAGTMVTYSLTGQSRQGEVMSESQRKASYYLYARGEYQVNDRLMIRAGGIAEVGNQGYNQFRSGNVGVSLRLGNDSFLHADFQLNSGYPGADLYYSTGGVFGDAHRFANPYYNPFGYSNW